MENLKPCTFLVKQVQLSTLSLYIVDFDWDLIQQKKGELFEKFQKRYEV